ncbi:hypothetical protein HYW20_06830 [Candidatus Woesearchaeota archaeon]|nr:hypothetical protein [Candidatus Woesearchaeota archaeon]
MAKATPKWVQVRYAKLWNKYNGKEIAYSDIVKILKIDGKNTISVFLNELRNAGWIIIKLDEKDTRKRNYILKSPEIVVKEMEMNP